MKNTILTLFTLLTYILLGCTGCKSINDDSDLLFTPFDSSFIKSFKSLNVEVEKSKNAGNVFISVRNLTTCQMVLDSIYFANSNSKRFSIIDDSLRKERYTLNEAKVYKYSVLRFDSVKGKKVMVYFDPALEEDEYGCYVAISENNNEWKKYFTGLTRNCFYYFKPKPTIPLFRNDSTIQLEASLLRKLIPGSHWQFSEYELLEDNLVVIINLNKLSTDSDNDGFTDILENKFGTDPTEKDTDGDGIPDNIDKNPVNKSLKNKFSVLATFLLNKFPSEKSDVFLKYNEWPEIIADTQRAYQNTISLIVSDDKHIKQINPERDTYVVFNKNEYKQYLERNPAPLKRTYLSIEEVKDTCDTYDVNLERSYYRVTGRKNDWIIKYRYTIIE